MSIINYIDKNCINPLRAIPAKWHYSLKKNYQNLNTVRRNHHIVVSLTSFPARFGTLHYAVKSILDQSMAPDVIFLCLTKEEVKTESELPASVLELKKYGIEFFFAAENLKPHNKYFYAAKIYPDSLLITVDDDNMYDKNLVKSLYDSFQKFPRAVSARRVHKIRTDKRGNLLPYNSWYYENKKDTGPSYSLLATGVGGVLYPPGILPPETFDSGKIKELCLNADDIWLKFMELKNNVPVAWAKNNKVHPLVIKKAQKTTLLKQNYYENQNDEFIARLQKYFGITLK